MDQREINHVDTEPLQTARLCYRLSHDQPARPRQELAQEIFIRCYRAAPSYQASAKFPTWIFHIARNTCLNELRRPEYRHPSEAIDDHPRSSPGANPESHTVSSELQKDRKSNRLCISIPPF